ncbi:Aip1 protein [Martiniozyma asiatica (nom. inval.)]|nr:Aip1 protein [Martiniozyma asiatica]
MSIELVSTTVGNPNTKRATTSCISYDNRNSRLVYPSGKTVILRPIGKSQLSDNWVYTGHNSPVSVAKVSPSGFYVASGDDAGNVHIWDCSQPEMILKSQFQVLSGRINDLAWDADSNRIIAVGNGNDKFGHCFTFDTGNSVGEISGHSSSINSVDIKPNRPYRAVTGGDDTNVVFFQGPPFKFVKSEKVVHNNFVKGVKFSKNGKYFVSVGADRVVGLFDGKEGDLIKNFDKLSNGGIYGVDWIDDESFVIASADATLKIVNAQDGLIVKEWSLEKKVENQFLGCVVAGELIAAVTLDGALYLFEQTTNDPIDIIYGHQGSITALSTNVDSNITGSYDGKLFQWSNSTATPITGETHKGLIVDVVTVKDKSFTISWDDTLKVIKDNSLTTLSKFDRQPLGLRSNGINLYVLFDSELQVFSFSGELLSSYKFEYEASSFDISKSFIVISDSKNFKVYIYNNNFDLINNSIVLRGKPTATSISNGESYVAIGDSQGKILAYKLDDFSLFTSRWMFHTSKINSIDWDANDDNIVSGSLDTNIIIYSVEKPAKNIKFLNAHKEGVNCVSWTGDATIVTTGADACVKHWKINF